MIRLEGERVLRLTEDPELLRAQIEGGSAPESAPLRFGVNTDLMIDGASCTLGYTPEILGPHFLKGLEGVGEDGVRRGGYAVVVGGKAYGSGSSREVAVVAHRGAGIRLVVAESLQRIFQENMVFGGLPFTTDLSVVERLEAGEAVDPAELAKDLPPFFRAVASAGGLLPYAAALLAGSHPPPRPPSRPSRPATLVEKLVSANAVGGPATVVPGDQLLCRTGFRGMHEYTAGMVLDLYRQGFGAAPIEAPEAAACFEDHFVLLEDAGTPEDVRLARLGPARGLTREMVEACARYGIPLHGPGRERAPGVCHRVVLERYARPGSVVVLTDSHTPTAGVLGCLAFGVGSTAMAFALRTGWIPVTVPKTVRVEVTGTASGGLSPKDLILHLIGDPILREEQWRTGPTDTCVLELCGPGLEGWSVDELSVLTNMTVEGGLMTGVVVPNASVRRFLAERGLPTDGLHEPDPGADYAAVMRVDLGEVPLTIATPGDSRNRAPLTEHREVAIHNVVIASCTGASLADLRAAAEVLRGRRRADGVRLTVSPASREVEEAARQEGLLDIFVEAGGHVSPPGCGACIGNGPGIPAEGEVTASTTNRNFDRRMGRAGPVYLVSPAVAAAAAVTGRLEDPRRLPA